MSKQIILLNGPSSSGKSTLSRVLADVMLEKRGERYAIISIDDYMKISEDETIYEDDVYEISGDMCKGALDALSDYDGVIIDHVITSERIFEELVTTLGACSIYSVHVSCPLDVLIAREIARGNRCGGSAEASYIYLYPKSGYDLTIDTSLASSEECAEAICASLGITT